MIVELLKIVLSLTTIGVHRLPANFLHFDFSLWSWRLLIIILPIRAVLCLRAQSVIHKFSACSSLKLIFILLPLHLLQLPIIYFPELFDLFPFIHYFCSFTRSIILELPLLRLKLGTVSF